MGTSQSMNWQQYSLISTYSSKDWEFIQDISYCKIFKNKRLNVLAQQYQFQQERIINNIDTELPKYEIRRPGSLQARYLVWTYHLIPLNPLNPQANKKIMQALTERIPYRFSDLKKQLLNESEIISILRAVYSGLQCFRSFKGIGKATGTYLFPEDIRLNQKMIGISDQGRIKIWVNENYWMNSVQLHSYSSSKNKKDNILTTFELIALKTSPNNIINHIKSLFLNQVELDYFGAVTIIENVALQNNIKINANLNIQKHLRVYNSAHNPPPSNTQISRNSLYLHQSSKPIHPPLSPNYMPMHTYLTPPVNQAQFFPKTERIVYSQHQKVNPTKIIVQASSSGFHKNNLDGAQKYQKNNSQRHKTQHNQNPILSFTKQNSHIQERPIMIPQPLSMIQRVVSRQQHKNQVIQQFYDFKSPNKLRIIEPIVKKSSQLSSNRQHLKNSGYKQQQDQNKLRRTQQQNQLVDKYLKKTLVQQPKQQQNDSKLDLQKQEQANIPNLQQSGRKASQKGQNHKFYKSKEQKQQVTQIQQDISPIKRENPTYSHQNIGRVQRNQLLHNYRKKQKEVQNVSDVNQETNKHTKNIDHEYSRKRRQERKKIYESIPQNQENKLQQKQPQKELTSQSNDQYPVKFISDDLKFEKKHSQKQQKIREQFVTFMPKDKKTLQPNFTPTKQNNEQQDDFLNVKSLESMLQKKLTKQKQQRSKVALCNISEFTHQSSPKNTNQQLNVADLQMKLFKFQESRVKNTNRGSENGSPKFQSSEVSQVKVSQPFYQKITSTIVDSRQYVQAKPKVRQIQQNLISQKNARSVSPNYLYESKREYYNVNYKSKIEKATRKKQYGPMLSPNKYSNLESKQIADEIDAKYQKYVKNRETNYEKPQRQSQKERKVNFDKYRNKNYQRPEIDLTGSNYEKYNTEDLSWITNKYKGKNLRNTQNIYSRQQAYTSSTPYRSSGYYPDMNNLLHKK